MKKMANEPQREKEKLQNMMLFSQRFLDTDNVPDLQEITEFMRTLTGAFCAVFNQYEDNGMGFTTKAIAVKTQYLFKAADILGFNPVGKKWSPDEGRKAKIQQEMVTLFENLHSLTEKTLSGQMIRLVETTFNIGQVAIVKTMKKEKAIGDFTLMMPKGTPMESQELAILFATQVGIYLDRLQYEQNLKESEEKLKEYAQKLESKNIELDIAVHQAEKANQAKSRYLAHMNHEIRTPLNGFVGFLQLMGTTDLDEEQQEYMHYMKQSTSHMLNIIKNVLDMAKIEAGEIELSNQIFSLGDEIQTALAPLHSLASQNSIHLQVTLDKNLPHQVEGDPDRLRQIILNLGGNAVKFTKKGQVQIALRCLETTQENHFLQLMVEDTGPGMTKETLDKLFLPFYQADDGSTLQSKGTGLGMTITKELLDLMDGEIQVDSTLGKGTRVEVRLTLGRVATKSQTQNADGPI